MYNSKFYVAGFNKNLLEINNENYEYFKNNFQEILDQMSITGLYFNYLNNLDLSFLSECSILTELVVARCERVTYPNFSRLTNLKFLQLGDTKRKKIIDLSGLYHLETLSAQYCQGIIGIQNTNVQKLILFGLKNTGDITLPKSVIDIKIVRLDSDNLNFLENLENLENLSLNYLKNLNNINSLIELEKMRNLEFFGLKTLQDMNSFSNLYQLTGLRFDTCSLSSIKNFHNMNDLRSLVLYNTNILDGNLNSILALRQLEFLTLTNKKNFNLNEKYIKDILNIKS